MLLKSTNHKTEKLKLKKTFKMITLANVRSMIKPCSMWMLFSMGVIICVDTCEMSFFMNLFYCFSEWSFSATLKSVTSLKMSMSFKLSSANR